MSAAFRRRGADAGPCRRSEPLRYCGSRGRIDGDILRDAYRAAMADDIEALIFANQRGVAFRTTAEMAVETTAQGGAFLDTCRAAWPTPTEGVDRRHRSVTPVPAQSEA